MTKAACWLSASRQPLQLALLITLRHGLLCATGGDQASDAGAGVEDHSMQPSSLRLRPPEDLCEIPVLWALLQRRRWGLAAGLRS